MGYTLTKKFRFEAAHRLAKGYEGKCSNIHGHSWNGHITVEVEGLDEQGLSIDFAKLGKFTKKIEDRFDHSLLLCLDDSKLYQLCAENQWGMVCFDENPTSEVIAKWIYNKACNYDFELYTKIKSVTIEETCTTSCTYTG